MRTLFMAVLAGGALGGLGMAGPAIAQTPSPSGAGEASEGSEIIVRGLRREQQAFEVPVQVTVLDAAGLQDADVLTLEDLQNNVPGAFFGGATNYGGTTIAIRGIGGSVTVFGEEPVAVFFDDQFVPRGAGASALLDLESVEVLRGPQGTLYGRNATAGAVLLRSARPDLDVLSGHARARLAEYGEQRYEGAVTLPVVTDAFAVRAAGLYTVRDGWATNTATGENIDSFESGRGRISALWSPTHATRLFGLVEVSQGTSEIARARYAIDSDNRVIIPNARIAELEDGAFALNSPTFSDFEDARAVLSLTQSFDGFDFVAETSYNWQNSEGATDSDGTGAFLLNNIGRFETLAYTGDIRLVSTGSGRLDWIVGFSAISDRSQMPYFFIRNPLIDRDLQFFSLLNTTAYAVYAEGSYDFTDRLALTIGGRYTQEEKDAEIERLFLTFNTGAVVSDPPLFTASESWSNFSPRAIVEYTITPDVNLYASYSQGFKGGGFNAFGSDPAYDPETVTTYEAGVKTRFAGNRGTLNLAAFFNDYEDLQIRLGVPGGGVAIASAPGAEIRGFEAEGNIQVTDQVSLFGSVAWLDTGYREFLVPDLTGALVSAAGNALSRAPEWQASIGAEFEHQLSDAVYLRLAGVAQYQDEVAFIPTNQDSAAWRGEAYTELDLRASLEAADGAWALAVFVQNATDEFVVTAIEAQGSFPQASFNEPRKWGVELTRRF